MPSQAKRVMLQEAEYVPGLVADIDRYLAMRIRSDLLASGRRHGQSIC